VHQQLQLAFLHTPNPVGQEQQRVSEWMSLGFQNCQLHENFAQNKLVCKMFGGVTVSVYDTILLGYVI
jgi:hypothetical protein